jgi:hypothetical protein
MGRAATVLAVVLVRPCRFARQAAVSTRARCASGTASTPMPLDSETTFDRCSGRDARSKLMAEQFGEDVAVSERELGIGQAIAVEGVVRLADG